MPGAVSTQAARALAAIRMQAQGPTVEGIVDWVIGAGGLGIG
jgi:hypothetical protein